LVDRPLNLKQLEGWITRWLDVDGKNPPHPKGISRAIHSFTKVDQSDKWWYLTGDFGSAPADALVEFIELLVSQGATRIVIKSGNA